MNIDSEHAPGSSNVMSTSLFRHGSAGPFHAVCSKYWLDGTAEDVRPYL